MTAALDRRLSVPLFAPAVGVTSKERGHHDQDGGVGPNVPNGMVSIANCLILWEFETHEIRAKRAIFSPK
jgi:hypothetical protein